MMEVELSKPDKAKAKLISPHVHEDRKISSEEFHAFCEGQTDSALKQGDSKDERTRPKFLSRTSKSRFFEKQRSSTMTMLEHKLSSTPANYQNSYRMHPTKKFFPDKAEAIIKKVLADSLTEKAYDYATFSRLTSEMSDQIKERVRESMELPRYKLVSFVTAGQVRDQGVKVGSRCVWNAQCDHYASASFSNGKVFAVGVIYVVYFE